MSKRQTLNRSFFKKDPKWVLYGILPQLIERFKGRVKIVHLFRHPAKVATSLTTHNVYNRGEWSAKMSITPEDIGVKQNYLSGDQWIRMDAFCKCLFWWTEINRFALDLKKKTETTPWLSLRFENIFNCSDDEALRTLSDFLEFLEFPKREAFLRSRQENVDNYQKTSSHSIDFKQIEHYNETIELMSELGYTLDEVSERDIKKRYQEQLNHRIKRKIKSITSRWWQRLRRTTSRR